MPVAKGKIKTSFIYGKPTILLRTFKVIELNNSTINEDPIALGYNAWTSPDLPIPCPRLKFFYFTIFENTLPSLSPTPELP